MAEGQKILNSLVIDRVRSGDTHFRVIRAVSVLRLEYALEYAVFWWNTRDTLGTRFGTRFGRSNCLILTNGLQKVI